MFKQKDEFNGRMAEMFGLLKELTSSTTPKKVMVREEVRNPITKNINAISFNKIEKKEVKENNEAIKTPIRTTTKGPLEEERKLIEPPEPQPLGKIEGEDYHSLPKEPMRKAMLNIRITKKVDIRRNSVTPCIVRGLKYMDALVAQGSDVNVMPLSTYNRLTDKKLVETDIRLSLASQSHIYPLGTAKDILIDIANFVRTIDQAADGKLRNKSDEESWALLDEPSLYENESWNDPKDSTKSVKAISMPQDVPSTSDCPLI
nr:MAK10-like protein [Tanacetum cinerariifolium]